VRGVGPKLIEALATNESLHRRCGHLIREHRDVSIRPHRFRDSKCRARLDRALISNKDPEQAGSLVGRQSYPPHIQHTSSLPVLTQANPMRAQSAK
jgi:hypothetical protein